MKHKTLILIVISGVAAGAIPGSLAYADWESVGHGVRYFRGGSYGECCEQACYEEADYITWVNKFDAYARDEWDYDQHATWTNKAVDDLDWMDDSLDAEGIDHVDPYGSDFADALLLATHGHWSCSGGDYWSRARPGDNLDDSDGNGPHCKLYSDEMLFGNGGSGNEANVFILSSCNSLTRCVFEGGGYAGMDGPRGVSSNFNMVNGFHGLSWYNSTSNADFDDYLSDTEFDDIGYAWLTEMHREHAGWNCPTSMVWGETGTLRSNFFNDAGFKDFKSTGDHDNSTYYYVCGCNPEGTDPAPLPTC